MNPWLVFIESNTSGTGRLFARAAREKGLRPILLTADSSRYPYVAEDEIAVLRVDTQDEEALLQACVSLGATASIAGVMTSSEYFIATAASLASKLGLPGPPPDAIRGCRDKSIQRSRLQAAGCGVPRFYCGSSVEECVAAANAIGFPVVVKPVDGSGSVGVKLCADAEQVASQAALLLAQQTNERGLPVRRSVLVESRIVGPEYSVETFCRSIVGITRKHLGREPDFVETGHDYPAELPESVRDSISASVLSALDGLGLGWGAAHTELRLTEDGPVIIEVNPRLAGGFIPKIVGLASGVDLISESIALATGQQPELNPAMNRYASIRFILAQEDGELIRSEGWEKAQRVPGVVEAKLYAQPGARIVRRGDFRDRIGHVIAYGDTPSASQQAALAAHAMIRLVIQPG